MLVIGGLKYLDLIIFIDNQLPKMSVYQNDLVRKLHGSSVQYSGQYRPWCCDSVSCFVSPPPTDGAGAGAS